VVKLVEVEITGELPNFLYISEGGVSMAHINDPEPPRYYDWMLWKMRQERSENLTLNETDIYKKEIAEMQTVVHTLQMRIKHLGYEKNNLEYKVKMLGGDPRQIEMEL
jgi:hypothetical protein